MHRALAIVVVIGISVAACGSDRPDVAVWEATWAAAGVTVQTGRQFPRPIPDEVCEDVLAQLRDARPQLLPAPDRTLDRAVREWLQLAEDAFFECPPDDGFEATFAELDRLRAEVDAALGSG